MERCRPITRTSEGEACFWHYKSWIGGNGGAFDGQRSGCSFGTSNHPSYKSGMGMPNLVLVLDQSKMVLNRSCVGWLQLEFGSL